MNIENVKLILLIIKYIIECGVFLAAGYFWGRHVGFDEGFKLGAILAKCRFGRYKYNEEDGENEQPIANTEANN